MGDAVRASDGLCPRLLSGVVTWGEALTYLTLRSLGWVLVPVCRVVGNSRELT